MIFGINGAGKNTLSINALRDLASGTTTVNEALTAQDIEDNFTPDEIQMMEETLNECLGDLIQLDLLNNILEENKYDSAINEALNDVSDMMFKAGIINESLVINTRKPKKNYVILTKDAMLKKLTAISILKIAQKAKSPHFKRYKFFTKGKKREKEAMTKAHGTKGLAMAKKILKKYYTSGGVRKESKK